MWHIPDWGFSPLVLILALFGGLWPLALPISPLLSCPLVPAAPIKLGTKFNGAGAECDLACNDRVMLERLEGNLSRPCCGKLIWDLLVLLPELGRIDLNLGVGRLAAELIDWQRRSVTLDRSWMAAESRARALFSTCSCIWTLESWASRNFFKDRRWLRSDRSNWSAPSTSYK